MLHIKSSFELPVSDANRAVVAIVAKELGYNAALGVSTPEEYIIRHFNRFYDDLADKVESGLKRHFGEAGQQTVDAIMGLYHAEVIRETTVTDDAPVEEETEEVVEEVEEEVVEEVVEE